MIEYIKYCYFLETELLIKQAFIKTTNKETILFYTLSGKNKTL